MTDSTSNRFDLTSISPPASTPSPFNLQMSPMSTVKYAKNNNKFIDNIFSSSKATPIISQKSINDVSISQATDIDNDALDIDHQVIMNQM